MKRKPPSQSLTLLILALMLVLGFGSYGMVNAEETYEVTVSNAIAEAGSTVTLDVAIAPGSEFSAAQMEFSFDPDKLTYVEPDNENLAKGEDLLAFEGTEGGGVMVINANDANTGKVSMAYINTAAFTAGGNIFKLTFAVKGDATGTIPVDVAVKELSKDNNGVALPILTTVQSGSVKIGSPLSIENFVPDKFSAQVVNTDITLTALGSGGTKPYEYQFYYQLGTETVVFKDFSEINTGVFTPTTPGTYTLFVDVKDADANTVTAAIENYQIIPKFDIKTFTLNPTSSQYINTPIQLSTEAIDGKAPYQYRYSYSLNGGTPVIFRAYGTTASASFTPTKAGIYTLTVDVKDASGNTASQSISDYPVVVLPSLASFTATPAAGQTVGQAIALTAEGSGGMAPYSYKFYVKTGTTTIPIADYSETASASFSPDKAGTYTLYVEMKDAGGKVATKTISNYTVVNALSVKTLTTDKASGQSVGTAIKLTATGSDGKSPYTYAFSYTLDGTTTLIRDYGTTGTASFTPTETGSYTLTATIKDATGNTASKTIADYQIVKSPGLSSFTTDLPSGQYPNTVIKLSATGNDGKAPYQYQFKSTSGGVTTIIQNYSASASATFKPLKAGNYTLTVDIKDANGSIGTASIEAYSIVGLPTVSSLSADPAAGQTLGKVITLTAGARDGKAPYMYKFYAKLGTTIIPVSTDYSAEDTITFTPDKVGLYTLCVDIKDEGGKVATKSMTGYAVVNPLTVKSFTAGKASGQAIGTSIPLTAMGSDGKAPYQYQFSYSLDGGEETLLKAYATTGSASFMPAKAGNYTLIADITDATGATARKTITDYTILADPTVDSFTATAPSGQGVNTSINLSAGGSSGKAPYQYQFYYKQGSTKVVIRPFAVTNTATFKPTKAGAYDLYVDVKDANGRIATKSQENYEIFGVPTVTSLTTDKASGQYTGTEINLTAIGSNGKAPYRYTFYARLGTGTDKIGIQDESDQNTAVFKPTQAGIYTLCVDVKDANGIVASKTLANYKVIGDPAIKTFTTGKVSGQAIGASIPLTALAVDGKAPYQYQFSYTLAGETTLIKDYSTTASATFSPTKAGSYTLTVNVKDAGGIIGTRTITDYIILPDPVVESFEATAPNGQGVNTSIQLTASGSSGKAPYQYQFYTKQGSTKVVIRPFAVTNTATFKPTKAGVYDLYVEIKDANGRIATKSQENYEIFGVPTVTSLTTDKASGQYAGTEINLTAAGSNGKAPYRYTFYARLGTGTDKIGIQDESDQNTAVFKPTQAGIYTLCVDVKDDNGIIASKTLANYKVIGDPAIKTFTTGKVSGQAIGASIPLTALAVDGKAPYQYQFSYTLAGETTLIKDYSTTASATFSPTKAGSYTLTVNVKDAGGIIGTRTITDYIILPDPVVESFEATAPNGQGVNTSIQLTASGSSGKAPYQYQFYTKQGSTKVVIRPFAVTNSATFKPTKAGVYDLYVEIKDANGRIATKSQENYEIFGVPTVTSLTTDKASGQYVDTAINLTAAATGGTGSYTYDFYCKLGTATDRISIQPEGDQNTAIFTPTTAGIYTLCVDVKDANGIIASKTLANYKVIANPSVKNFIASKTSGQPVNTSITLTAQGTDGKTPYQYKFSYSDGTTTTTIRDYSTLTTAIFKPTKAGTYTLTVEMKDGGGKTDTKTIETFEIK